MLDSITIKGFKSFADATVHLGKLTVVFGPNASGKSNLLEALLALSRLVSQPSIAEALAAPIRGRPLEMFRLPTDGLKALLHQPSASLSFMAEISRPRMRHGLRYQVTCSIRPRGGEMRLEDEFLALTDKNGDVSGNPRIAKEGDKLIHRHRRTQGRGTEEKLPLPHTIVSAQRLGKEKYPEIWDLREELAAWSVFYLDPRHAMRTPQGPSEVSSIGVNGEHLAPFLYRLKQSEEHSRRFGAISRALREVIPSISELDVEPDDQGTLDVSVRQDGVPLSSRVISEGTLRVLALCAIAANPWRGPLVAYEEPENGVTPQRIEVIASLLAEMTKGEGHQVIVTTHSPLFVAEVCRLQRGGLDGVQLLISKRVGGATVLEQFEASGPLFEGQAIEDSLISEDERTSFVLQQMMRSGWLDA
jgi:predicted ATPase